MTAHLLLFISVRWRLGLVHTAHASSAVALAEALGALADHFSQAAISVQTDAPAEPSDHSHNVKI